MLVITVPAADANSLKRSAIKRPIFRLQTYIVALWSRYTRFLIKALVVLLATSSFLCGQSAPDQLKRKLSAPTKSTLARADEALRDTFTLQGVKDSPRTEDRSGYDWQHKGPKKDKEWAWFLNRHRYFEDLYVAYVSTGDIRYRIKIFEILDDWLAKNESPPRGMSFSSAWRPLEAARRILESWDIVHLRLADAPEFTPELKARFIRCMEHHGDYLQDHHALYGNHLITEMIALLKVSLLLPEAARSEEWKAYSLKKLREQYTHQVYPGGAHKELSSHYQRVIALNFERLLELLKSSGQTDLIQEWQPRVDKLWHYFAQIQKPNGFAPLNNDSDLENISELLKQSSILPQVPSEGVLYFPLAGQVIFRGSQKQKSPLWAFFDIGPRGTDHQHEDFMHLSLSYGDFDLFVDNGRYTYQPGAWREYFQGPNSHNILLIDGQASKPKAKAVGTPINGTGCIESTDYSAAWGTAFFYDHLGNETAEWQRITVLLNQESILIVDYIITFRERALEGFWHGSPGTQWAQNPTQLTASKNDAAITILNAGTGSSALKKSIIEGQTEPVIQGWHSTRFNRKESAPVLYYKQLISEPTAIAWLVHPQSAQIQLDTVALNDKRIEVNYSDRSLGKQLQIYPANRNTECTLRVVEISSQP